MKKCVLQIISLCLALFMAYVGGGVNIYHYCCEACREHQCKTQNAKCTIEDTQSTYSHECCTHQHADYEAYGLPNGVIVGEADNCGVTRVEAPDLWKFSSENESFVVLPLVAILPYSTFNISENEMQCIASLRYTDIHSIAKKQTGRAIIVRKSAYLI